MLDEEVGSGFQAKETTWAEAWATHNVILQSQVLCAAGMGSRTLRWAWCCVLQVWVYVGTRGPVEGPYAVRSMRAGLHSMCVELPLGVVVPEEGELYEQKQGCA